MCPAWPLLQVLTHDTLPPAPAEGLVHTQLCSMSQLDSDFRGAAPSARVPLSSAPRHRWVCAQPPYSLSEEPVVQGVRLHGCPRTTENLIGSTCRCTRGLPHRGPLQTARFNTPLAEVHKHIKAQFTAGSNSVSRQGPDGKDGHQGASLAIPGLSVTVSHSPWPLTWICLCPCTR